MCFPDCLQKGVPELGDGVRESSETKLGFLFCFSASLGIHGHGCDDEERGMGRVA